MDDEGDPALALTAAAPIASLFVQREGPRFPLAIAVKPVGGSGGGHGPPTVNVTWLDGPLVPVLLRDRTRTTYVPVPTPATVSVVAALPVSKLA